MTFKLFLLVPSNLGTNLTQKIKVSIREKKKLLHKFIPSLAQLFIEIILSVVEHLYFNYLAFYCFWNNAYRSLKN